MIDKQEMTVARLRDMSPNSMLTKACEGLSPNKRILCGRGIISDDPRSDLAKARKRKNWNKVIVGGRAGKHANDGRHWAITR